LAMMSCENRFRHFRKSWYSSRLRSLSSKPSHISDMPCICSKEEKEACQRREIGRPEAQVGLTVP
jgi:hypothetical protein